MFYAHLISLFLFLSPSLSLSLSLSSLIYLSSYLLNFSSLSLSLSPLLSCSLLPIAIVGAQRLPPHDPRRLHLVGDDGPAPRRRTLCHALQVDHRSARAHAARPQSSQRVRSRDMHSIRGVKAYHSRAAFPRNAQVVICKFIIVGQRPESSLLVVSRPAIPLPFDGRSFAGSF